MEWTTGVAQAERLKESSPEVSLDHGPCRPQLGREETQSGADLLGRREPTQRKYQLSLVGTLARGNVAGVTSYFGFDTSIYRGIIVNDLGSRTRADENLIKL